jgi:uncharacterized protein
MNPVIDTAAFSRSRGHIEGELPFAAMPRLGPSLRDGTGAARFACDGGPDGRGRPALRLRGQARLELRCDLCGEALASDVEIDREFYFVRNAAELEAIPVDPLEDGEALVGSERFELAPLVEDELILALPISPRHPQCAAAGARIDGEVAAQARESPFAALKALRRPS